MQNSIKNENMDKAQRKNIISLCTGVKNYRNYEFLCFNHLTPELNSPHNIAWWDFLLQILLLEPCISLIYVRKANKCNYYSFSLLIMYGSSYMFRQDIASFRKDS
jgi:hypothetical protein